MVSDRSPQLGRTPRSSFLVAVLVLHKEERRPRMSLQGSTQPTTNRQGCSPVFREDTMSSDARPSTAARPKRLDYASHYAQVCMCGVLSYFSCGLQHGTRPRVPPRAKIPKNLVVSRGEKQPGKTGDQQNAVRRYRQREPVLRSSETGSKNGSKDAYPPPAGT